MSHTVELINKDTKIVFCYSPYVQEERKEHEHVKRDVKDIFN